MTTHDLPEDLLTQTLAGLTSHRPDAKRAARIRAACHRRLDQRPGPAGYPARATGSLARGILEPALVTAASAFFLFDVLRRALTLSRF
jgi:hypothetical protein